MEIELASVIPQIVSLRENENKLKTTSTDSENISTQEFSNLVNKISDAYHREWEKEKLEFAQNFLARTWAGMPLPVLSICGRGTQEIRYSKYLGYFLDGSKSHGLGSRYLDELLKLVTDEKIDTYNAKAETEKWLGIARNGEGNVCDNVISCHHHVVFIEQKINSGESQNQKSKTNQLSRYDEAIASNEEFSGKKHVRIFITPSGKTSSNSPNWKAVSHEDLARIGLIVLGKGGISGVARENLKRFLLDLLLGPFTKSEEEIQNLVELAKACVLTPNFRDRLRFDRLVSQNELLVNILMEG
ncbi:PD-(D/E)XK nuclease superfamily protein [anaerobic digester metagenome]